MARKIFLKCSRNIVYGLFGVIVLYLFLLSLFGTCAMAYTDEHIFFIRDFPLAMLTGLMFLVVFMAWGQGEVNRRSVERRERRQKEKDAVADSERENGEREAAEENRQEGELTEKRRGLGRWILPGITACWFVLLIFWILKTLLPPIHDQYFVFYGAKEFLEGDYARWQPGGYLYMYPFQNTLMLFYTVFHLIFGEQAVLAVELFNLACWYLGIVAISRLTESYFGKTAAKWTYAALLGFLPMWGYVTYIYGTVPGLCCGLWGILTERKYEETGKNRYLAASGILLMLAVMWKNNYIIFAAAVMIMISVYAVREKSVKPLWGIFWILGLYFLGTKGTLFLVERVTGQEMTNGIPLIVWVAMGFRESNIAPGWFNMYTEKLYEACGYQGSAMIQPAVEEIRRNFALFAREPAYALRFFSRKLSSMWNSPMLESVTIITKRNSTGALSYTVKDILYNGGIANTVLFLWQDIMQSVLLFGLVLYLVFDRKKLKLENACMIITVLGGFLFHIFWEGKCQYTLPYYVLLFPFSVQGYLRSSGYLAGETDGLNGIGGRMRLLWREGSAKLLAAVLAIVLVIAVLPGSFIKAVIKMNDDTADYIWYCRNETQWMEEDYRFGDPYEERAEDET